MDYVLEGLTFNQCQITKCGSINCFVLFFLSISAQSKSCMIIFGVKKKQKLQHYQTGLSENEQGQSIVPETSSFKVKRLRESASS